MVDNYEDFDIQGVSKLKKDFQQMHYNQQSIVLYADELRNLMKDTTKSTSIVNEEMKQWVLGAQELSKHVGHINREAFNHTSNMVRLRREYDQLGKTGKEFLKIVNFKGHFNIAASQLSQYKGLFLGTFKTLANFQIDVARNISQLGREGFDDLSGGLRDIDDQILNVSQKLSKMATKQEIQLMDPSQQSWMIEVQKQTIKLMKDRVVLLQESRDNMYDTVQIQNVLNQKLKPYMDRIDKVATGTDGLRKGIEGISTAANTLGVDLVGLDQFSSKLDMTKPVQKLKAIVSQTTFKQALSFKKITKDGKINFKGLGKSIIRIMGGVIKMLSVMFIGLFTAIALGIVGMMIAGFKKAWQTHQEYQDKFIGAQKSAQVVSGRGTQGNFGAVYSAMGGANYGGQDADDVYQNARRYGKQLVTIARNTRQLERSFAVSTGDAAKILFNLKQAGGMTQQAAMQFATRLGKMSQKFGFQSSKVLSQLASLSGETMLHFAGMQQKFIRSSIFARKLNLTVQQMYRTMQGVSDVQKTIQNAMQLSVLTGKQLNVQQLLFYAHTGQAQQGLALMFDTYKGIINAAASPQIKNQLAQMFKMDFSQLLQAKNQIETTGGSAAKILGEVGKAAKESKNPMSTFEKSLKGMSPAAAAFHTAMEALNIQIKDAFYNAFKGSVGKIQNLLTSGRLIQIISKIANWLGKITERFINWVTAPSIISAIQGALKKIYQVGKGIYDKVLTPIYNVVKWAYGKGGISGVLGLAAGVIALLNIGTILRGILTTINVIKGSKGLFSGLGGADSVVPQHPTTVSTAASKVNTTAAWEAHRSRVSKQYTAGVEAGRIDPKQMSRSQYQESQKNRYYYEKAQAGGNIQGAQEVASGGKQPSKIMQIAKAAFLLASAVALLAGAVWVVAQVPSDKVWQSVGSIGALFAILIVGSYTIGSKGSENIHQLGTAISMMAAAMMLLGQLNWGQLAVGVVGIAALVVVLWLATNLIKGGAQLSLIILAGSIWILSHALVQLAQVEFGALMVGIGAMAVLVVAVSAMAFGLQYIAPFIIVGIGVLALMGGALYAFARGMNQAAKIAKTGIKPEEMKLIGSIMREFAVIVGQAMSALVANLEGVGKKQLKVVGGIIEGFNGLVQSLGKVYQIAQKPDAMKKIVDAIDQLSQSKMGQKVGKIMKQLLTALQVQGTKAQLKMAQISKSMMEGFNQLVSGVKSLSDVDITKLYENVNALKNVIPILGYQMKKLSDTLLKDKNYNSEIVNKFGTDIQTLSTKLQGLNNSYLKKKFQDSLVAIGKTFTSLTTTFTNFANSIQRITKVIKQLNKSDMKKLKQITGKILQTQAANALTTDKNLDKKTVQILQKAVQGKYAEGGIVEGPQVALIGQQGPEAVIPLRDSAYSHLAQQSLRGGQTGNQKSLQELARVLARISDRPIQITVQMDHKKVGKILANNAAFTPGIA